MLAVEDDAVLVIIQIGGILQIPGPPRQVQRDDAVVLPRRETGPAGITGVLPAQGAFGVTHRRRQAGQGDIARVLLRLGEVDGDLKPARLGLRAVADVLLNAAGADIVIRPAEAIEPVCRRNAAIRPEALVKLLPNGLRAGRDQAEQPGTKALPGLGAVLAEILSDRVLHQYIRQIQDRHQAGRLLRLIHPQQIQQAVDGKIHIFLFDQPRLHRRLTE